MAVGWEPIGDGSPRMPIPGDGGTGVSDGDGLGGVSDGGGPGAGLVHVPSDQTHPRDVQSFSRVQ
jgi:hypothetical protein